MNLFESAMHTNPFEHIRPWIGSVLQSIKKEIKNEHLPSERQFYKTYFGNRPLTKLTIEEIFTAYEKELLLGNQSLIEWAVNRWVFKHGEIYRHFAEKLSLIDPNFQEISFLSPDQAESILKDALVSFGARDVYLFSRLNGVVLPDESFAELEKAALAEVKAQSEENERKIAAESMDQLLMKHQREIQRLQEKYEDRVAGVQRKYIMDTEALTKQIRSLQQQLQKAPA